MMIMRGNLHEELGEMNNPDDLVDDHVEVNL